MFETFPVPGWPLWRLIQVLRKRDAPDDLRGRLERLEAEARALNGRGAEEGALGHVELQAARLEAQLGLGRPAYERALRAKARLQAAGDAAHVAAAAAACVEICIETGDLGHALEHLREAQAAARAAAELPALARLLFQQAGIFLCVNELETATRCCEEVLLLAARTSDPALADLCENARAALAFSHARQARALERRGRHDESQQARGRALGALPHGTPASPFESLHLAIHARALLGDVAGARRTAALFLHRARRRGREPGWMAQLWLTMGLFRQYAGDPGRGIVRYERALAAVQSVLHPGELADTLQMLAHAHASGGQYAQALRWLRRSREIRAVAQLEQEHLRFRVAARERDREARRLERQTEALHAQRLAVVGRLMAQIYHALGAPLADAHEALEQSLADADAPDPALLAQRLRRVVARINEAALLTRQLKMFSYRAAPQIATLDLPLALQEAWQGLAMGRGASAPPLALHGAAPPQVSGDAQRLAVLLRILLIELERLSGGPAPRVEIATVDGAVRTSFWCVVPGGAAEATSVGYTLCEEIAAEMQGALRVLPSAGGTRCLALDLPIGA